MKDIKDYLHLYIGCGIMNGINDKIRELRASSIDTYIYARNTTPKLILRPLSDKTEEEAKELDAEGSKGWKIVAGDNDTHSPNFSLHHAVISRQSHEVKYLLSKGFDLFNLIPEGMAIDKTTLK